MSFPLSTLSTDRPDSSSGGVSRIAFIARCDPETQGWVSAEDVPSRTLQFEFPVCDRPGAFSASFNLCLHSTEDSIALTEAELHRLRCYLLIHRLPDAGLKEAEEELSEMCEFYSRPVPPPKPLPPAPKSVPVKVGATVIRPVFPITDEE